MVKANINGTIVDLSAEDANALSPASAATPPPAAPVITYKADVLRRMTDDESDIFTAALEEAPSRQRGLWYAVQYLDHADPVFASFRTSMISAFGVARTDQILAPSMS